VSDNCYGRKTSPSAVHPTEEQKERIARHKQLAMQRFAERETAKTAENTAAEDSSGASTDARSHTSRYTAKTNPFHHVTDHELSDLLEYLPISYKQEEKERHGITAVLKKYGYRQIWHRWLSGYGSVSELNQEWHSADWTRDDLNYLVSEANRINRSLKKYSDNKTMVIPKFEKMNDKRINVFEFIGNSTKPHCPVFSE
jgi:hypothetical protein